MGNIKFIRKKRDEYMGPPNSDPTNQRQWTPRYKWDPNHLVGGVVAESSQTEKPMCKKCGVREVRSRSPKRKGMSETVVRTATSHHSAVQRRICIFNTTKIYAANNLCEYCNIKKQNNIGRNSVIASGVKKPGWMVG